MIDKNVLQLKRFFVCRQNRALVLQTRSKKKATLKYRPTKFLNEREINSQVFQGRGKKEEKLLASEFLFLYH